MNIMDILNSDAALTCGITIAGAFWTLFKGSNWLQARRLRRVREALEALEAAVEATYREYVRALKEKNPDGNLTSEEQALARQYARERAVAIAKGRGIDLIKELGADYIDLWTGRIVRKLKQV